jgi:acetylornithine deacetylase/succinyl-diaminopimelate desuccinylase-like protein
MEKHSTPTASLRPASPAAEFARDARVGHALHWFFRNLAWIASEQIAITQIPAPPFCEAQRGAYLAKLFESANLRVRTDELGNVVGEWAGETSREVVLLMAHLDTVFPAGTEVRVRRENGLLRAPGISDNGVGLASLAALARALTESRIRTRRTVVFAADVGEEGDGNLRGVRNLVEEYGSRLKAVIAVDGASTDYVITKALAARRIEIAVTGPGGHSWSDFGAPNPINALARGIATALQIQVPANPRTTFNVGKIEGGNQVNTIPARASIKMDIRSEHEKEIGRMEAALIGAIRSGVAEENAASVRARKAAPSCRTATLEMQVTLLGVRPGGALEPDSPLLAALNDAERYLGIRSTPERASTDANIPLSLGIPAISIGAGGRAGGAHTLGEWYDPAGREVGLQRLLLTVLGVAGLER